MCKRKYIHITHTHIHIHIHVHTHIQSVSTIKTFHHDTIIRDDITKYFCTASTFDERPKRLRNTKPKQLCNIKYDDRYTISSGILTMATMAMVLDPVLSDQNPKNFSIGAMLKKLMISELVVSPVCCGEMLQLNSPVISFRQFISSFGNSH